MNYGSGSTRSAAISKALAEGALLDKVLPKGGWSRESIFQRFYARSVWDGVLADCVLKTPE